VELVVPVETFLYGLVNLLEPHTRVVAVEDADHQVEPAVPAAVELVVPQAQQIVAEVGEPMVQVVLELSTLGSSHDRSIFRSTG
jgi:hypothetical protein